MTEKPRNFSIHISPETKDVLKILAKDSGMTLSQYVEAVLNETVTDKPIFKMVPIRVSKDASKKKKQKRHHSINR